MYRNVNLKPDRSTLHSILRLKRRSMLRFAILLMLFLTTPSHSRADDGEPIAIRYWPSNGISMETMWNFHFALNIDSTNRALLPRSADVEFLDDFWEATNSKELVLDRHPNELKANLVPTNLDAEYSGNAIKIQRIQVAGDERSNQLNLNVIDVDGVTILDSSKYSVSQLAETLSKQTVLPKEISSVDVLLIDDPTADVESLVALQETLSPRLVVLRDSIALEKIGEESVERISHNTIAVSDAEFTGRTRWVTLAEKAWTMDETLADLFAKKESACKSSRAVFSQLSLSQMNFKPSNGTHTPRWNSEHMMGRELLFFSQIFHAVDPNIQIMDLNPKQMPAAYQARHADWTGLEESNQMERVEAFTRRFGYLLEGMELDKTAKGSSFWTPRALLKQMDAHYTDHTANVVKKKDLSDWPAD